MMEVGYLEDLVGLELVYVEVDVGLGTGELGWKIFAEMVKRLSMGLVWNSNGRWGHNRFRYGIWHTIVW